MLTVPAILSLLGLASAAPTFQALPPDTLPADTYLDPNARTLVESALRRRGSDIQGIESYEQTQQTIALLKILSLGIRQIEEGKVLPAENVIERLRERREDR